MFANSPASVIRAPDFPAALAAARANPDHFVEVFLASWCEVDRCRALAAAAGLAGRLGIHHHSALDALVELRILPGPPSGNGGSVRALLQHLDRFVRAAGAVLAAHCTVILPR